MQMARTVDEPGPGAEQNTYSRLRSPYDSSTRVSRSIGGLHLLHANQFAYRLVVRLIEGNSIELNPASPGGTTLSLSRCETGEDGE